jgi:hypothetical protein
MNNIVKMNRVTGKIPSSITDILKDNYDEYIVLAVNKDKEFCFTINAESHANVFQMLLIAGGHIYRDQFE